MPQIAEQSKTITIFISGNAVISESIPLSKTNLNPKYNSILVKEQSHVASEIKRRSEPISSGHIELTTALLPQLRNRRDCPLKSFCIHRHAVANPSKISQIVHRRPQPRQRPRRSPPESQ